MSLTRLTVAGLAVWNYAINRKVPPPHYVAANLTATMAVAAAGRRRADRDQLGMRPERPATAGLTVAAAVAAGAIAASRLSRTAALFDDQRVNSDDVAYQALVRIPFGTVLFEEVAFRSVLPVLLDGADRHSVSVSSAALFGLWHIVPTLNTLDINEIHDPGTRLKVVAAGVAATGVAGMMFDKLRLRTGSVLTPMLVHWSANAVSYLIAARRRSRS